MEQLQMNTQKLIDTARIMVASGHNKLCIIEPVATGLLDLANIIF
jgi:hypothetical protein